MRCRCNASGVTATEYRIDGGDWLPYLGPFFVGTFGPHTLEFRSTDAAGNVEDAKMESWGSDFNGSGAARRPRRISSPGSASTRA